MEDRRIVIYVTNGYKEISVTRKGRGTQVSCRDGNVVEGLGFVVKLLSQGNDTSNGCKNETKI